MATPIPENRARFTADEVVAATGGVCARGADRADFSVDGVTTDSRGDVTGKLFVALSGDHFDGHRFVDDVLARGASAVIVRRGTPVADGSRAVEVDDPLVALGALARAHRRRWGGMLVAIGGSAGKTTTRSAARAALEAVSPGAVYAVAGNLNNRIGLPMVLFGLTNEHAVAAVELGTNQRGEMRTLAAIAEPNVGVLTLVDTEHSEGIGSLDDIEEEEGDLFRALPKNGAAIVNGDDARAVRQLLGSPARRKITYGTRGASDYRIARRESLGLGASRITLERPRGRGRGRDTLTLDVPLIGPPGALAVAAAVAVADCVAGRPVPPDRVVTAFAHARLGEPGRLRPVELADRTVIVDDTYNANPASVRAAVSAAREIADDRGARLFLVLGEMRELGAEAAAQHDAIGREVSASGASVLVAIGGDAARFVPLAAASGLDATFAADAEAAVRVVLDRVRSGDVVLVKASRGIHAEQIVDALVKAKGRAA
jgi:UDP-N-acetylmuramoyl-tripeptide--D-alanyl-D-alanine ligase